MADTGGTGALDFRTAFTRAVFLCQRLAPLWADEENVGILLPPSVGGSLVNWVALLMGKRPVNLNYTLSPDAMRSCIEQCGLTSVVTSEKVLKRLKIDLPIPMHPLEGLAKAPRLAEKLRAAVLARCCPTGLMEKRLAAGKPPMPDDVATLIFSSGSTGEPKGVMLTHRNIVTNVRQMERVLVLRDDDRFLGILPFFHSFGFTTTIAVPAVLGLGAAYHSNPMEAKAVGPLVADHRVSILLATPTFLQFYQRGCHPDQFRSLRLVAVAAEKLPERSAAAFEQKFGIRPTEAYGCTECSPCVTLNSSDPADSRPGSVGRPLPGMEVKIVDPESRATLPVGDAGLLLVKGPNVMQGYLGQPDKTAEVLRDGWYNTGDIARQDQDGFITITDRLSRFSKIGGEMVPHIRIEEKLHECAGLTDQAFAVTSVSDPKKGERLIVLHTRPDAEIDATLQKLAAQDIPNLWKPRRDQFLAVHELPYLGSGKLDLNGLKNMAADRLGQ
ncbi:N/A [soil metagenome]